MYAGIIILCTYERTRVCVCVRSVNRQTDYETLLANVKIYRTHYTRTHV